MSRGYKWQRPDLIATLVRGDQVFVDVFPDRHELHRFCDHGGWRVRSVSTPATIVTDLNGRRMTSPLPEQRYDLLERR